MNIFNRIKTKLRAILIGNNIVTHNSKLGKCVNIAHSAQISNSEIGQRTSIGRYSTIRDSCVGSYCSISWNVTIGALSHPINRISSHSFSYRKKFGLVNKNINIPHSITTIGNDVWIGCGATIVEGVSVGNGAVIGAGAVVTKDIPSYAIAVGIPAKIIKYRFDKEICEKLNSLDWWNLPEEIIKREIELFEKTLDEKVLLGLEQLILNKNEEQL